MKTITILDLEGNQIDDAGTGHLANALQYNKVSSYESGLSIYETEYFIIVT